MAQQKLNKRPPQKVPQRPRQTQKNSVYRKQVGKKRRFNKDFKKNMLALLTIFLFVIIIMAVIGDIKSGASSKTDDNDIAQKADLKSLKCLDNIENMDARINKYYIYGTHFNIEGSFEIPDNYNAKKASLVLRKDNGKEIEYDINYEICEKLITFKVSDKINEGIYLDGLEKGNYYLLLKIIYDNNEVKYYSMENKTQYPSTEYYTVTKNRANKRISIFSGDYADKEISYLQFNVERSRLPGDVYDVVIDAGHGGADTGASNGKYTEADITIKYAIALKNALEKQGLKVKLTRDGNEGDGKATALSAFGEDGRVNTACASKAKYCFSIHLNSAEQKIKKGGLQIYCNANINTSFAENLAKEIVKNTGMDYSDMVIHKIANGVYCRNFTKTEITSSNSSTRFEPYKITEDTNYYFIIRELGGIATNAYIDGRNPKFGKNNYCDSNVGIESYLLEIGYIIVDKDLDIITNGQKDYIKALSKEIAREVIK